MRFRFGISSELLTCQKPIFAIIPEASPMMGHMIRMTLTLTLIFEMPLCAILAYNSYLKLYFRDL